jgi:hypothetical protein
MRRGLARDTETEADSPLWIAAGRRPPSRGHIRCAQLFRTRNRKNFRRCNRVTPSIGENQRDALHEGDSAPKSTKFVGNVVFWPLSQ